MDFLDLPIENIQEMFVGLTPDELKELCVSNKYLNNILCSSTDFWKYKIIKEFGKTGKDMIKAKGEKLTPTILVNIWRKLDSSPKEQNPFQFLENYLLKYPLKHLTPYKIFTLEYMHKFGSFPDIKIWNSLDSKLLEYYDALAEFTNKEIEKASILALASQHRRRRALQDNTYKN